MVTLAPSSAVGICPLTKSVPCQRRVSGARPLPKIETQVLAAMVALPPSAFDTAEMAGPAAPVFTPATTE
jgi:hypothetical protein